MEHIASAGNTAVPAYLVLVAEGFRVEHRILDGNEEWLAERDDMRISGSSTVEVLGLYRMRQQRGCDWKASDSDIEAFLQRFYPDKRNGNG